MNKQHQIIELFEEFLKARGIRLPSSDAEMIAEDALEGNEAVIYGMDYGELYDGITAILEDGITVTMEG